MLFEDRINRFFASYGIRRYSKNNDLFMVILSMVSGFDTFLLNSEISFRHNTIKFRLNGITQQEIELFRNFLITFFQDPQELMIEIEEKLTDEEFRQVGGIRRTTIKELIIELIKNITNRKLFCASFLIGGDIIYEKIFPCFVFYFNEQFKTKYVQNMVGKYYNDEKWNLYNKREGEEVSENLEQFHRSYYSGTGYDLFLYSLEDYRYKLASAFALLQQVSKKGFLINGMYLMDDEDLAPKIANNGVHSIGFGSIGVEARKQVITDSEKYVYSFFQAQRKRYTQRTDSPKVTSSYHNHSVFLANNSQKMLRLLKIEFYYSSLFMISKIYQTQEKLICIFYPIPRDKHINHYACDAVWIKKRNEQLIKEYYIIDLNWNLSLLAPFILANKEEDIAIPSPKELLYDISIADFMLEAERNHPLCYYK